MFHSLSYPDVSLGILTSICKDVKVIVCDVCLRIESRSTGNWSRSNVLLRVFAIIGNQRWEILIWVAIPLHKSHRKSLFFIEMLVCQLESWQECRVGVSPDFTDFVVSYLFTEDISCKLREFCELPSHRRHWLGAAWAVWPAYASKTSAVSCLRIKDIGCNLCKLCEHLSHWKHQL